MSLSTKTLNTRVIQKHDTAENWAKAVSFIPKKGEIIIYDADSNNPQPRMKIGNGTTTVVNLPFCNKQITDELATLRTDIDTLSTKPPVAHKHTCADITDLASTYETKSDATSKYNELNTKVEKATLFIATYDQTTYSEIKAAHDSDKPIQVKTTELIPGAYDANGNLLHTWEEMIAIWTEAGYGDITAALGTSTYNPSTSLITILYSDYDKMPSHIVIPEDVNVIGRYVLSYYPSDLDYTRIPDTITITFLGTPLDVNEQIIDVGGTAGTHFIFNFPTFTSTEAASNGIYNVLNYFDNDGSSTYEANYLYDLSQYELNIPYYSQLISANDNEFVFRGHIKSGDIEYVCSNTAGWSIRDIQIIKCGDAQMKYDYINRRIVFSFA